MSTGKQCLLARVLCDCGSKKCFVKRSLVQKLKLKSLRKENLLAYLFYEIVALELTSVVQLMNSIKIKALEVDNITDISLKTLEPEALEIMRTRGYKTC